MTQDEKEAELHELVTEAGSVEDIREILEKYPTLVNARGRSNNTLLMRAAVFGREAVVRLLLEKGANPDLKNKTGFTALMAAALEHRVGIIGMLLEAGAAKGAKDNEGRSALDYAEEGDSQEKNGVLRLLKGRATSPAKTACRGKTCSIMGGSSRRRTRKRSSKRQVKLSRHKGRRI